MINLLPTEQRKATLYARRNTILVRWLTGILAATAGIAVITGGSLFYLKQDSSALRNDIDKTKADLVAQNEKETLERVEQMSGNLKLAVNVLSNEVLFSKLLQSIGLIMPPGTVLKSLSLTNNIASQGIENGIFDKADLQSVTCNEADTETIYVCTVSIRALFKSDNPFLLIGKDGS
jgi:hypothetical protein